MSRIKIIAIFSAFAAGVEFRQATIFAAQNRGGMAIFITLVAVAMVGLAFWGLSEKK